MRLHPAIGFDDLIGERGRGQDLRDERIRIKRDGRYQALQLFWALRRVSRSLTAAILRGLSVSLSVSLYLSVLLRRVLRHQAHRRGR